MSSRRPEPDEQLASSTRRSLAFLFANHGAEIISNERLPGFGNAQIFVRAHNLTLRVLQTAGSVEVLVARWNRPNEWHLIDYLLIAADPNGKFSRDPVFGSLAELGELLEPRVALLNDALSDLRFTATIDRSRQAAREGFVVLKPRTPRRLSLGKRALIAGLNGISRAIQFLVPKPKDSYKKRLPIGSDDALEKAVRTELSFLFDKCGAIRSSNGRFRTLDHAIVSIDAGNLRFRAVRDRGFVEVSLAPRHAIRDWSPLETALMVIQPNAEIPKYEVSSILRGAGGRIAREFKRLNDAFSETQYRDTREKLQRRSKELQDAWIENWNRKYPGPVSSPGA